MFSLTLRTINSDKPNIKETMAQINIEIDFRGIYSHVH